MGTALAIVLVFLLGWACGDRFNRAEKRLQRLERLLEPRIQRLP